jgi:hypothetical protein
MGLVRVIVCVLIAVCLLGGDDALAARRGGGGGTQVYLLRGIFNVSVGLDALAAKLSRRGIRAQVNGHGEAALVAEQAIRDYRSGRVRSIIMVGHSLGAGAAVQIAEQLQAAGIPVTLIVSLDPVSALPVPGNVRRVVNFYLPGSGSALAAGPGFNGALRNVDMQGVNGMDHMTIQSMESMHRRVLSEIGAR